MAVHRPEAALFPSAPSAHRRLARLVTEVLAPAPTVAALLLITAWHSAASAMDAIKWALLAVVFTSILPTLYILNGVRVGRLTDHHVRVRRQRRVPLLVASGSVLLGLTLLTVSGAPRDVVALVGAGLVGLVVAIAITLIWKISIHTAVAAGTVAVLTITFGPALLSLAPLAALSGWARLALRDHTLPQVVAGGLVGAAIAATAFPLFR